MVPVVLFAELNGFARKRHLCENRHWGTLVGMKNPRYFVGLITASALALLIVSCADGTQYAPKTSATAATTDGIARIFGSTGGGSFRTGGANYTPNEPDNIQILTEAPSWKYVEVGCVQAQGGPFALNTDVYRLVQKRAAAIGADAVIVNRSFLTYHGRGDNFISKPVKGVASARPENVSR